MTGSRPGPRRPGYSFFHHSSSTVRMDAVGAKSARAHVPHTARRCCHRMGPCAQAPGSKVIVPSCYQMQAVIIETSSTRCRYHTRTNMMCEASEPFEQLLMRCHLKRHHHPRPRWGPLLSRLTPADARSDSAPQAHPGRVSCWEQRSCLLCFTFTPAGRKAHP